MTMFVASDTDLDKRYVCVSMENINYVPVNIDELRKEHAR